MPLQVAVLTSTDLPNNPNTNINYLQNIKNELNVPGGVNTTVISAQGNYNSNSTKNIMRVVRTNLQPNRDLILTVGGLVMAKALANFLYNRRWQTPFLMLIGSTPSPTSGLWNDPNLIGGVNLDTANQNNLRAQYMLEYYGQGQTSPTAGFIDVSQICLLYNENSHMGAQESMAWQFHGRPTLASSVNNQAAYVANPNPFNNDFQNLPAGTKAVIVSADPFFTSHAADIMQAAMQIIPPIPICFPNEQYVTAAGSPQAKSMIYGPNLAKAYTLLGQMANTYLNAVPAARQPMGIKTPEPPAPSYTP